jgi:hypothetical protein
LACQLLRSGAGSDSRRYHGGQLRAEPPHGIHALPMPPRRERIHKCEGGADTSPLTLALHSFPSLLSPPKRKSSTPSPPRALVSLCTSATTLPATKTHQQLCLALLSHDIILVCALGQGRGRIAQLNPIGRGAPPCPPPLRAHHRHLLSLSFPSCSHSHMSRS